jgi:ABC-2 type transport system ATP-binding protein
MSANSPLAFEMRDVSIAFKWMTVLDHVSLQLKLGRRCALLGPNGSGKTTLLRALAGRIGVDGGEVRCMGVNLRTTAAQSRPDVRYLTQHFSLYQELTTRENLEFCAAVRGVDDVSHAIDTVLNDFDLYAFEHKSVHTLSGGIRQRLMLAALLLGDPKTLLLDEPTVSLDHQARAEFWRLLDRRRTKVTTLVLTTHLEADVEHCDCLIHLHGGHLEIRSGGAEGVTPAASAAHL